MRPADLKSVKTGTVSVPVKAATVSAPVKTATVLAPVDHAGPAVPSVECCPTPQQDTFPSSSLNGVPIPTQEDHLLAKEMVLDWMTSIRDRYIREFDKAMDSVSNL
jgi:hypothetical protein